MSDNKQYYCRQLYDEQSQKQLWKWWSELQQTNSSRAQLKRCDSIAKVASHKEVFYLKSIFQWASIEAVATIAGILARIEGTSDRISLGTKLAQPKSVGGNSRFSENRYKTLLSCRNWDEFYRRLRRAITAIDGQVDPIVVADIILRWAKESNPANNIKSSQTLNFELSDAYYTEAEKHNK